MNTGFLSAEYLNTGVNRYCKKLAKDYTRYFFNKSDLNRGGKDKCLR